jgi:hypothetical protein
MLYKYIFCNLYSWYKARGEKDIPAVYSIGIVSLLQYFTVLGPLLLLESAAKIHYREVYAIVAVFTLAFFNIIWIYKGDGVEKRMR